MDTPLLQTKLYIPPVRPLRSALPRARLVEQLDSQCTSRGNGPIGQGELIATRPGGYLLAATPEDIERASTAKIS